LIDQKPKTTTVADPATGSSRRVEVVPGSTDLHAARDKLRPYLSMVSNLLSRGLFPACAPQVAL
jgi:hypothetical protein